jgi:hypothetical protein
LPALPWLALCSFPFPPVLPFASGFFFSIIEHFGKLATE